jgi:hypothetical protein
MAPADDRQRRQRARNLAMLVGFVAFALLLYAATLMRFWG